MSDFPLAYLSTGGIAGYVYGDGETYKSAASLSSSWFAPLSTLSAFAGGTITTGFAPADKQWSNVTYYDSGESRASNFRTMNWSLAKTVDWREIIQGHASSVLQTQGANTAHMSKPLFREWRQEVAPKVEILAEWDGYVEELHKDHFTARLRGLKGQGVAGKDEEGEIPKSDVDAGDMELVVPGGFFRLMITYETPKVGPKRRYTTVQFRRLPAFTQREIDAAEREADELFNAFQVEEDIDSARA